MMRILVTLIALATALPCQAQSAPPRQLDGPPGGRSGPPADELTVTIGVAPVLSPVWMGSRDMALSIYPDLRLNYGDVLFASVPEGLGWNAVNTDGWRAGPLAKIRFGRDEEEGGSPFLIAGSSDALIGMGDVDATAEVGGFIEKRFGDRQQWRARVEVRRGFGGHEGVVGDGSLSYQTRFGRTIASFGPRATVASSDFMQTFFGIDDGQAARTGLARYDAKGGLLSYGVGGSAIHPLNRRSALTLFTSLERLGEQAADSPLVEERGRRTQFTIGLGYGFRFSL
ncbi:MipA/OmpV family protein [Novosphingobium sp. M1R2S20]|uniref:MipA/OmpV family protein n=1 Tax=Novosphingobium rhizovicinum TaxID=3228928 RepID=A0ABV3RBF0_9SPHN